MTSPHNQAEISILPSTLHEADQFIENLGVDFAPLSRRFSELSTRFSEGRFHLAVLGQFKRGKSTFVNALLGEELLPAIFRKTECSADRIDQQTHGHDAQTPPGPG